MSEAINHHEKNGISTAIYNIISTGPEGQTSADLYLNCPAPGQPIVIFTNGAGRADFDEAHLFIGGKLVHRGFGTCHFEITDLTNGIKNGHVQDVLNGHSIHPQFETIGRIILAAAEFLSAHWNLKNSKICLLASGDGTAAALFAAATNPSLFSAMVISGGRLASALTHAAKNIVPCLFISGSEDNIASVATQAAYASIRGPKEFSIIKGAGHRLREPGALEDVAEKSLAWFDRYGQYNRNLNEGCKL